MTARSLLLATALLAAAAATASAQARDDVIAAPQARDNVIATPVLRANVSVAGDVVRIGDVIDNAGTSAQIAIYRAPDLGTTGSLATAHVLSQQPLRCDLRGRHRKRLNADAAALHRHRRRDDRGRRAGAHHRTQ